VEFCCCAGGINIETKAEDAEDRLSTETRPDALSILVSPRLSADCDLTMRDPDFDRSPLKGADVSPDPEPIAHRCPTTIQWPYQLALRLIPVLQLVPGSRITTLKDRARMLEAAIATNSGFRKLEIQAMIRNGSVANLLCQISNFNA